MDYITTYRKIHFTPLSPQREDILIEDIAHALSLMSRANGHFPAFHSVAQHCIECCEEALARGFGERVALACLLHDASEAYLADITRPVKKHLPQYRSIENGLLEAIYKKYLNGLTDEEQRLVKEMDDTLLYYEFYHFMGEELMEKPFITKIPEFPELPFRVVEQRYLELFGELYVSIHQIDSNRNIGSNSSISPNSKIDSSSKIGSNNNIDSNRSFASKTPETRKGIELFQPYRFHFDPPRIEGVLFDMDGLILDTEKLYTRFWQEAANALGYPMTKEQALGMRSMNRKAGEARIHSYFGPDVSYKVVREKRIELMDAFVEKEGVSLKPGVPKLLDYLHQNGIKTAIATSSPIERTLKYLSSVHLENEFDEIVTAYMVKQGKPEPYIYQLAAEKLGLKTQNCLAMEDSPSGLLSACRAGCLPVMIPDQDQPNEETKKLLFAKADRLDLVIDLIDQLKK